MNLRERAAKARLERTKELAGMVRDGTFVKPQLNVMQSWFPERPQIKKDQNALQFIFAEEDPEKVNSNSVPG